MRAVVGLIAILALSACASRMERAAADCRGYGFQPGTEAFANCAMQVDLARGARAQRGAFMGYIMARH